VEITREAAIQLMLCAGYRNRKSASETLILLVNDTAFESPLDQRPTINLHSVFSIAATRQGTFFLWPTGQR
jgi:hypothetical protein